MSIRRFASVLPVMAVALTGCLQTAPSGPQARTYEYDFKGAAGLCEAARVSPSAGKTTDATMKGPSTAMFARHTGHEWMSVVTTLDETQGLAGLAFATAGDNLGGPFRLRSSDPAAAPIINHRYDLEPLRSGPAAVTLRAPGLDPTWSTSEHRGETLLAAPRTHP